jgi:hypothetical protein
LLLPLAQLTHQLPNKQLDKITPIKKSSAHLEAASPALIKTPPLMRHCCHCIRHTTASIASAISAATQQEAQQSSFHVKTRQLTWQQHDQHRLKHRPQSSTVAGHSKGTHCQVVA